MKAIKRLVSTRKQKQPHTNTAHRIHKTLKVCPNYRPVSNISSVLADIDSKLGVNRPPSVEYLYVVPVVSISLTKLWLLGKGVYSSSNPYGHSAVRYTTSDGQQHIMNIVGKPGSRMVNFLHPNDYLFGDPSITCELGSEQGGVFNRTIIGFRLENYPSDKIDELHKYYLDLQDRELKKREVTFNLMALPSWIRIPFFSKCYERGNCALWSSKGFVAANIFKQGTIFPKYIFVKLYIKSIHSWGWYGMYAHKKNERMPRCNIVCYNQVVADEEKEKISPHGWTTPLLFSKSNRNFRNLKRFAHCNVDLEVEDDGTYTAKVSNQEPWIPKFLGPIWEH